ncbi:Nuclear pore complex protein Nup98-Nup96-like, autopeptidase S59 domain [Dillenia turbinata]|uniref:Nuclear pore complex protein Nup98-Nup96-like, autopeptidase S59 domain n=1 Tax=Dillenia turbinata TaxID=194707 RepID=A0AAN8Z3T9_9MAGN
MVKPTEKTTEIGALCDDKKYIKADSAKSHFLIQKSNGVHSLCDHSNEKVDPYIMLSDIEQDFVVRRHGCGSIRFFGELDVRQLDLESLIQFDNREVIVYMDNSKKPLIRQGLNKPIEITLPNIKCFDKRLDSKSN